MALSCDVKKCYLVYAELKRTKADLEAVKSQAESTNREYDRLMEEHRQLQVQSFCELCWKYFLKELNI